MAASRWKSKLALKRQPMKSTGECSRTQRSSQHNGQNNSSNETSTSGSKQMFTVFWVVWIMKKMNWFNSTSISILYSSLIKPHCRINFARYINSTNTLNEVDYHGVSTDCKKICHCLMNLCRPTNERNSLDHALFHILKLANGLIVRCSIIIISWLL